MTERGAGRREWMPAGIALQVAAFSAVFCALGLVIFLARQGAAFDALFAAGPKYGFPGEGHSFVTVSDEVDDSEDPLGDHERDAVSGSFTLPPASLSFPQVASMGTLATFRPATTIAPLRC